MLIVMPAFTDQVGPYLELWWLPVGAGGRVVVHTSRWWELLRARREHRRPRPLFHAALEACDGENRYVIEMAPAWGQRGKSRGVVATGPVGLRWLGVTPLFRYEVRCWRDGSIPDADWAPAPPTRFPVTRSEISALLERVSSVPRLTWGRDVFGVGDMWNSNSLICWLLHTAGTDTTQLVPPGGGSAPGWVSGRIAATGG